MADPYPRPETTSDTNDDTAVWDPKEESTSGTRRWIKLLAIILAVLILLFVVLQLIGVGGTHGPSIHSSSVGIGIGSFAALEDRSL